MNDLDLLALELINDWEEDIRINEYPKCRAKANLQVRIVEALQEERQQAAEKIDNDTITMPRWLFLWMFSTLRSQRQLDDTGYSEMMAAIARLPIQDNSDV